jgi:hypothetical protein
VTVFTKHLNYIPSPAAVFSAPAPIAQANSWERVAKPRPHGDDFNEKGETLIVCIQMEIADINGLSQGVEARWPLQPSPQMLLHRSFASERSGSHSGDNLG